MKLIQPLKQEQHTPLQLSSNVYFDGYKNERDYLEAGIIPIEPMTAKEVMEKDIDKLFNSEEYIAEVKIDGVRANIQFRGIDSEIDKPHCRVFTRRRSVVTGFYGEKSDNLPQIRDINIPELWHTILDGELVIPGKDFKTTSAILNCLPLESVERQLREGAIVFNAFDCLYYCNENIMNKTLRSRKSYLHNVCEILKKHKITSIKEIYSLPCGDAQKVKSFYNDIVNNGGEGIMIKDLNAPYEMTRTRAYQKIKKKFTRDVVILGFNEPTKEYSGKFPKNHWDYWVDKNDEVVKPVNTPASVLLEAGYIPVTKNWYEGKVGAIVYGVKAPTLFTSHSMLQEPTTDYTPAIKFGGKEFFFKWIKNAWYVIVGECEGMTDEERTTFTNYKKSFIGKVIEVECNEVFKDTGKMRHPRFMRIREDKSAEECTWEAHIE